MLSTTWDTRHFYQLCFDLYVDFHVVYFKANVFGTGLFGKCVFCLGGVNTFIAGSELEES